MGDVINLVKAQENISEEETQTLEKNCAKRAFTYDDYFKQMGMIKKMGSFSSLFKMLPGFSDAEEEIGNTEQEFKKSEAMILSMTLTRDSKK